MPEILKIPELNLKYDFKDFTIATYGEIPPQAKELKAKFMKFDGLPNGFEMLGFNDILAYKIATQTLFCAFDSGADFLLVNDEKSFYMFDTLSKKCEKIIGRSLENFYVLRVGELISLANAEAPKSLKEHRLKVRI
ncbi:MAG: hypothetical protein LUC34_07600 [Campylobacter sp.]|nr:hypothetical protein [Campylobacter sp.]